MYTEIESNFKRKKETKKQMVMISETATHEYCQRSSDDAGYAYLYMNKTS